MDNYDIRHYIDDSGKDLYQHWLTGLRDRVAQVAVIRRVARMTVGNFGDHKFLRDGVSELRIDVGQGYRVYFAQVGDQLILLTNGGDKRTQEQDIVKAITLLRNWEKRNETRS